MSKTIQAYKGSLDLYYQVEASDGSFGQVYPAGNVTNFEITPDAEETEVIDTGNANYGQAADSEVEAKPTKFSFTVNRMNIDNWAVAFMGEVTARTAAEGTVTDEAITVVQGGMFVVAGLDISAITITGAGGTPTYVLDTDYEIVDAALGVMKWLSAGTNILVDYTTAAETGWLLSGGTKSSRFLHLFGKGINRYNNKRCLVNIARGSVRPGGGFSFVGTEVASMPFEGTIAVPTDGSPAFTIMTDA